MNTLLPNFERICAVANTFLFIGIDRELADTDRRLGTSPNNVTEPVSKRPLKRLARFVDPWPFRRGNRPLLGSNRGSPSPARLSARPSAWAGRRVHDLHVSGDHPARGSA